MPYKKDKSHLTMVKSTEIILGRRAISLHFETHNTTPSFGIMLHGRPDMKPNAVWWLTVNCGKRGFNFTVTIVDIGPATMERLKGVRNGQDSDNQ